MSDETAEGQETKPKRYYELEVSEIATALYVVAADSEDEAKQKLKRGEWDTWRSIAHDDPQIHEVRELL